MYDNENSFNYSSFEEYYDNQEFQNNMNELFGESQKKLIFKIEKNKMYKFFKPVFSLENILTWKFRLKEDQKSNVIETNLPLIKNITINVTNEEITHKYKNILEEYQYLPTQKMKRLKL